MVHGTLENQGRVDRQVTGKADRWWWAPLTIGVLWFVIAWLVLRANYTSLATVGVLVGVVFVVSAVGEAALAWLTQGGWAVLHALLAVVFVFGAVWSFVEPVDTFFALASVLGLLLFLQGAFYVARGVALRDVSPYWGLTLGSGVLIAALGLWVSTSDRVWTLANRAAFILLWVGLMAIIRGISDIVMAFELRRLGREVQKAEAVLTDVLPPPIPPQRATEEDRQQARAGDAREGGGA